MQRRPDRAGSLTLHIPCTGTPHGPQDLNLVSPVQSPTHTLQHPLPTTPMPLPILLNLLIPSLPTPVLNTLVLFDHSRILTSNHLVENSIRISTTVKHRRRLRNRLSIPVQQFRQLTTWKASFLKRLLESKPVASIGENFASFGLERPYARMSVIAELVKVVIGVLLRERAVFTDEKFAVLVGEGGV